MDKIILTRILGFGDRTGWIYRGMLVPLADCYCYGDELTVLLRSS